MIFTWLYLWAFRRLEHFSQLYMLSPASWSAEKKASRHCRREVWAPHPHPTSHASQESQPAEASELAIWLNVLFFCLFLKSSKTRRKKFGKKCGIFFWEPARGGVWIRPLYKRIVFFLNHLKHDKKKYKKNGKKIKIGKKYLGQKRLQKSEEAVKLATFKYQKDKKKNNFCQRWKEKFENLT